MILYSLQTSDLVFAKGQLVRSSCTCFSTKSSLLWVHYFLGISETNQVTGDEFDALKIQRSRSAYADMFNKRWYPQLQLFPVKSNLYVWLGYPHSATLVSTGIPQRKVDVDLHITETERWNASRPLCVELFRRQGVLPGPGFWTWWFMGALIPKCCRTSKDFWWKHVSKCKQIDYTPVDCFHWLLGPFTYLPALLKVTLPPHHSPHVPKNEQVLCAWIDQQARWAKHSRPWSVAPTNIIFYTSFLSSFHVFPPFFRGICSIWMASGPTCAFKCPSNLATQFVSVPSCAVSRIKKPQTAMTNMTNMTNIWFWSCWSSNLSLDWSSRAIVIAARSTMRKLFTQMHVKAKANRINKHIETLHDAYVKYFNQVKHALNIPNSKTHVFFGSNIFP